MSPEEGVLDDALLDRALSETPDKTLAMLVDLTAATDPRLRELALRLAGRIMIGMAKRGSDRRRGVGRMTLRSYEPEGGDIDIDSSLDAIGEMRRLGATDTDKIKIRGWMKPSTALCLVLDRSGSMGGRPLATSAMAAAAVANRFPSDYSVVAFANDVVIVKSQLVEKDSEVVMRDVLALRGFGTTNLSDALIAAEQQLCQTRAGRKVTVLLSDCRATVLGDAVGAARHLDELVIIAPLGDDDEARKLGAKVGAKVTAVSGPSDIPDAFARLFD